jgi:hypothetical protein
MCETWGRIRLRIAIILMPIRILIRSGSGSESAWNLDPDPDRHQNDADPHHWKKHVLLYFFFSHALTLLPLSFGLYLEESTPSLSG